MYLTESGIFTDSKLMLLANADSPIVSIEFPRFKFVSDKFSANALAPTTVRVSPRITSLRLLF